MGVESETKTNTSASGGFGPIGGGNGPKTSFGFGPIGGPMPAPLRGGFGPPRGRGFGGPPRGRGWRGRGRGWRGRGRGGGWQTRDTNIEPISQEEMIKKLNEICTKLISIREEAKEIDKARINSAVRHLRKIGTESTDGVKVEINLTAPPKEEYSTEKDQAGSEKLKESLLIMREVVRDLSREHEPHRIVVEHVVSNLQKLVAEKCTFSTEDKMNYDDASDGYSRATAVKKLLEEVPEHLMNQKETRMFKATVNTVKAFLSKVTPTHSYRSYESPPRRGERSRREGRREDRGRDRRERRRRRRSRSRSRDRYD